MTNVSCRKCGREVASGARWCPDCGTILGESVKCRSCGSDIPTIPGKGCPHCGADRLNAYGPYGLGGLLFFALFCILSISLFGYYSCQDAQERKQRQEKWDREHQEWRKNHGSGP